MAVSGSDLAALETRGSVAGRSEVCVSGSGSAKIAMDLGKWLVCATRSGVTDTQDSLQRFPDGPSGAAKTKIQTSPGPMPGLQLNSED
ncbi:hypothetical protein VSDG_01387 [Cytospora chrysosperma]|uniref:Uncharacterized protein n=1 Tax=Cytospora chrysosperma TaxID=252740 RepID=A0A423WJ72_CYTCH|nr:hypothetical protein VSDG_01387 [Valsa sordida]